MELKGPYEPGKWNFSIHVGQEELHQTCVLVVHLNLKHEAIVQGIHWHLGARVKPSIHVIMVVNIFFGP